MTENSSTIYSGKCKINSSFMYEILHALKVIFKQ